MVRVKKFASGNRVGSTWGSKGESCPRVQIGWVSLKSKSIVLLTHCSTRYKSDVSLARWISRASLKAISPLISRCNSYVCVRQSWWVRMPLCCCLTGLGKDGQGRGTCRWSFQKYHVWREVNSETRQRRQSASFTRGEERPSGESLTTYWLFRWNSNVLGCFVVWVQLVRLEHERSFSGSVSSTHPAFWPHTVESWWTMLFTVKKVRNVVLI